MVMPREKLRIMPVDVRRSAGALLEELTLPVPWEGMVSIQFDMKRN